jgi:FLYWCH zinc finger domain
MDIIKSQKGKQQLLYEGYRYRRDKLNQDGSSSWRCIKRECAGRLKKKTDGTLQTSTEHMRAPDTAKNESEKINANIRKRAENGVEKPRQIIVNSIAGVSLEAAHLLPSYSASQRTVERKRKRPDVSNPRPLFVQDIILPDTMKVTTRS